MLNARALVVVFDLAINVAVSSATVASGISSTIERRSVSIVP